MRGVEGAREQIEGALALDLSVKIGEDDRNVAAKFPNDLAASAARRSERVRIGHDGDGVEFVRALSLGESFENGNPLRADREAVAGVFDVAAGEDATGLRSNGSADTKLREGRVSVLAGRAGGSDEMVFVSHDQMIC